MLGTGARKRRILIVDDDPDIARLLGRALMGEFDIDVALNAGAALAMAAKNPPDLAMLDVMMPGIDGFGLAERLRLLPGLARLPLMFLTAKGDAQDQIRGIQVGAKHYITKPFKLADVVAKVKKALK
ncbi:MAG: response regulator [Polyangiaceae bacterium]|nr:response regulator [Myxococcales bacterium]MCB9590404.1 response regulator [Polyangiaceae bacterium]MCB9608397.1 response regulator [Polyangiaceae bacterium]